MTRGFFKRLFRGFQRPPWWGMAAAAAAVAALVFLGVYSTVHKPTDPLSKAELARMDARAAAAAASESAAAAPPSASAPIKLTRPATGPLRVLFAGDSITAGAFAPTDAQTFRGQVVTALQKNGPVTPTRIGNSGLTTAQVFPDVAGAGDGFDLAVVELGTNDVPKTSIPDFQRDYTGLLDAVRQKSPHAVLLCLSVWGEDSPKVQQMNKAIATDCTQRSGGYVPISDLYGDPANRGPAGTIRKSDGAVLDDFHPNLAGHTAIAQKVLAGLAY